MKVPAAGCEYDFILPACVPRTSCVCGIPESDQTNCCCRVSAMCLLTDLEWRESARRFVSSRRTKTRSGKALRPVLLRRLTFLMKVVNPSAKRWEGPCVWLIDGAVKRSLSGAFSALQPKADCTLTPKWFSSFVSRGATHHTGARDLC